MADTATTVNEVVALFGSAMQVLAAYRRARAQWQEANPWADGAPDDTALYDLLTASGSQVVNHADAIILKFSQHVQPGQPPKPTDPGQPQLPPAKPQRALAVVTHGPGAGAGVALTIDGQTVTGVTNADGYVLLSGPDGDHQAIVSVQADGFQPLVQTVSVPPGEFNIHVSPTRIRPAAPTRAQLLDVKADFCNLRDSYRHQGNDGVEQFPNGRCMFTSTLASMSPAEREDWIQKTLAANDSHIAVSVTTGYVSGGQEFFPVIDFAENDQRLREFASMLWDLRRRNLIPIVFLASGDPGSGDDRERFRRIGRAIRAEGLHLHCVFVSSWESVNGGWSSKTFNDVNLIMADDLGDDAVIFAHLSQGRATFSSHASMHHPQNADGVELDDPFGGEINAWFQRTGGARTCGSRFDGFLFQANAAREGNVDDFGQSDWEESAIQIADRFLERNGPAPGMSGHRYYGHPDANGVRPVLTHGGAISGPDWFAGPPSGHDERPDQRKRPVLCLYEVVAYYAIRDQASDEWITRIANRAWSFGYRSFGNGQPRGVR